MIFLFLSQWLSQRAYNDLKGFEAWTPNVLSDLIPQAALSPPSSQSPWPPQGFLEKCQTFSCLSACSFAFPGMLFSKIATWLIPSFLSGLSSNINFSEKLFMTILFKIIPLTPCISFLICFSHFPIHYLTDNIIYSICILCALFSPTLECKLHEGRNLCLVLDEQVIQ